MKHQCHEITQFELKFRKSSNDRYLSKGKALQEGARWVNFEGGLQKAFKKGSLRFIPDLVRIPRASGQGTYGCQPPSGALAVLQPAPWAARPALVWQHTPCTWRTSLNINLPTRKPALPSRQARRIPEVQFASAGKAQLFTDTPPTQRPFCF